MSKQKLIAKMALSACPTNIAEKVPMDHIQHLKEEMTKILDDPKRKKNIVTTFDILGSSGSSRKEVSFKKALTFKELVRSYSG